MTVSHAPTVGISSQRRPDLSDVASLFDLFAQVPDPRDPRGVRHRLATVLTLAVLAMLCGVSNFRQVADRIAELPQAVLAAAGARMHVVFGLRLLPGKDTVRRLIEAIDALALDLLVCGWLAARTPAPDAGVGLAIDGKRVRHSGGGGEDVQLFAALRHDQAVVVGQVRVPAGTTEVTQVAALLDPVPIAGLVITADAAHPSRDTAAYVTGRDADYVFTVKGNKPVLLAEIWTRLPVARADTAVFTERERRNGRIVERALWTADAAGIGFPGAAQVFRLRRDTYDLSGRRISKQVVHGITSLAADTPAKQLAAHIRRYWSIENKLHWVRDVLLGEDRHHAYVGAAAHGVAVLRNLVIGLIRLAGHTRIKEVLERNHGNKASILSLLSLDPPALLPSAAG